MASGTDSDGEQVVPNDEEESDVRAVQAHYLRSPSPSQYSLLSDTFTESIFMEPIHLSSSLAAKQIINEELKSKEVKPLSVNQDMFESAEQLMVEDLYNRIKEKIDDRSIYNTPCVLDLQRILMQDRLESPMNAVDEVWPNVFIAEKTVAVNKGRLKRMGISHILNAGHGTGVFTNQEFYNGMDIQYLGIEVDDFPDCDISKHLRKGAEFLDEALLTYRGKVLVNSVMGISRSAVLIAAYLMIFHHMTILEALMTIRKKRAIYPNDGFLKQLRELNETLLEEREEYEQEESGDDDTTSQGSVREARAHSIMAQEEDTGSLIGAKAHSITVQEEETGSVMGSVMSSAANSSVVSKQPTLIDEDEEEKLYEEWRIKQGLPPREQPKRSNEAKELKMAGQSNEEEDDIEKLVFEWQRRNEKYQSGMSDEEDGDSLMGGRRYCPSVFSDVESVSSADIQMLKQQLEASGINRARRGRVDSETTEDSTSNIWTQRIQDIEKEAIKRSHAMDTDADGQSGSGRKERDIDEESLFSETNSLYNFCKKNKDKLTALERWKIKRIQYGLHKKDSEPTDKPDGEQSANEGEVKEKELTESNLTAYQAWKMNRQKKLGMENKDEIVELGKGEDSASAKRKQRREEILERSKKTLEESQSILGWETESAMSGSIPLAAFLPSMPPGFRADDSSSVFSMQSNRSCLSQARGTPGVPQTPTIPLPNITPVAGDAISMASIQNWIANVVTETIAQKQNEILMMSRTPSVTSPNTRSADHGRNIEDDKTSLLSMQSGSAVASSLLRRDTRNIDNQSTMSFDSSASLRTEGSGIRRKVTETSKPLYSLFGDDINLKELNKKEKELKTELSGKMSDYRREKIATDSKRSTLFKKKKAKDEEDEEVEEEGTNTRSGSYRHLSHLDTERAETSSAFSGSLSRGLRSSVDSNVEKWLSDLKSEDKASQPNWTESSADRYMSRACTREATSASTSDRLFRSRTEQTESSSASYQPRSERNRDTTDFSSTTWDMNKGDNPCTPSKFRETTRPQNHSPEPFFFRKSPDSGSRLDTPESMSTFTRAHRFEGSENVPNGDVSELGAKRKFNQSFAREAEQAKEDNNEDKETNPLGRWAQYRKGPDVAEDKDDDDIIAAWRDKQEETKAKLLRRRKKE